MALLSLAGGLRGGRPGPPGGGSFEGEDGTDGTLPVLSVNGLAIAWTDIKRRRNIAMFIVVAEIFMVFRCCLCL